jgi:hypothetical protein
VDGGLVERLGRELVQDDLVGHDVPRRDRLGDGLFGVECWIAHSHSAETHIQRRRTSTSARLGSSALMSTLASVPRKPQVVGGR